MLIQAKADDPRSYMEQGVEEILPQSIVCKRDCIFTNLAYPALNFRCANSWVPASVATPQMRYGQIFQFGRLVCRKVNIVVYDRNGRTYGGEILDIKKSQCDPVPESLSPFSPQPSQSSQDDEDWEIVDPPKRVVPDKRRQRSNSIEICEASSLRPRAMPSMIPKCTFGDVFCGAGGTTQGAVQAGLQPLWALDNNETAIATYAANFPEALPLLMNAHDFPTYATRRGFKVNICHFSCPCKFWSSAQ
jgi:DNA (cytosine-5)-methyltransferase 1